jgi:hypothetical protein
VFLLHVALRVRGALLALTLLALLLIVAALQKKKRRRLPL